MLSQPIKCGDVVRLTHLATKKNLHSHLFQSPLSNNQEVSAFGDNGEGDEGDNWIVDCDEDFWRRDESVRLKHEQTKKYLHLTGDAYGRPIHGQLEVSSYSYPNQLNLWRVLEGVYIKPAEEQKTNEHSEL
jgi:dolichyl-phosphate-mannose--protein O-mannosyl transferase